MIGNKILLTGGTGQLGRRMIGSGLFKNLIFPGRAELDISSKASVELFFKKHPDLGGVIHCAALARLKKCEDHPAEALTVNIVGTSFLAQAVLKSQPKLRFIYISTDRVYAGQTGDYRETDPTEPYSRYGWSKLGGECAARLLPNHCIIRTSFFDPGNILFVDAATDMYSSKMPINDLVKIISFLLTADFVGVINVGETRDSEFNRYKKYKPDIKPSQRTEIIKEPGVPLYHDSSMNLDLNKKVINF